METNTDASHLVGGDLELASTAVTSRLCRERSAARTVLRAVRIIAVIADLVA
jgi:hypothetical protein